MAVKNPILDAMLNLHELTADEQKRRIDYETAQTKRNLYGRSAVKGVVTELAEQEMKRQKQKEQIAKSGEGQQANPQAMIPPSIDVSGQTGGRDMAASLKSAAEIAKFVSGGAGIKSGMIGGVFGQQAPNPGISQGINPASMPPVGQPGIQAPTGPPGSIQPVQQQLSGGERALSALGGVLGITSRSPQAAVTGLGEAITGKRTVDYQQIPTVDQQAAKLAPGLSVLIARSHSTNPDLAKAAQAELDKRSQQMTDELGPDIGASALRQAEDMWLLADEKRRIKEEDPLEKAKREKAMLEFGIEQQVAQHGESSLTQGQREVWERGRRQTTNVINLPGQMEKGTKKAVEGQLDKHQTIMSYIDAFDSAFFAPGYELMSFADRKMLQFKDRTGTINPEEADRLGRYRAQETAMSNLNLNVIHPLIGAAMAGKELEHADGLILKMSEGGTAAQAASNELREMIGLAMFRYETILDSGSIADPRYAQSLGNIRNAAKVAADQRVDNLMQTDKLSEEDAVNQMRQDFKNRYGLDIDRLMGVSH